MASTCRAGVLPLGALRPHIACGGTDTTPPMCSHAGVGWTMSRKHNGTAHMLTVRQAASTKCLQRAFDAYLCSLPARVGDDDLKPADWAFSSNPPTVAKKIVHFAMQLYLSMTVGGPQPFRHIMPEDALQEWRWRPQVDCLSESSPSIRRRNVNRLQRWLRADVCDRTATGAAEDATRDAGANFAHSRAGARLLEIVMGNSSGQWPDSADRYWMAAKGGGGTTAGLWLAGQLVRRVWKHSMGPCTRARVDALAREPLRRLRDGWSVDGVRRLAIAVHVRRGDACERWSGRHDGDSFDKTRPCFSAAVYARAARELASRLREAGASRDHAATNHAGAPSERAADDHNRRARAPLFLLVASDSPDAADELASALPRGEFEVLRVGGPRGGAWGAVAEGTNVGRTRRQAKVEFIEARNERGLVDRAAVVASVFADVALLSQADAFVGTAASWTSRLMLLAIAGEKGAVPPFEMVDKPMRDLWFANL